MTRSDGNESEEQLLNRHYRGHDTRDWDAWAGLHTTDARDVLTDSTRGYLTRVKTSHRGVGERLRLQHLIAGAADQDYLDEICLLTDLERLELEWPVTAVSLDGLRRLIRLKHLSIDSPRHITDFTPLLALPELETLLISNAKHLTSLDWLAQAHHLRVLGIEGSINTAQRVESLAPLAGLGNLEAFLATNLRVTDRRLAPLADCPQLRFLACAKFFPRAEFDALHVANPGLVCSWFDPRMWR